MAHHDVGHFAGHRHQVVGHVAVAQRAVGVVEALLEQRAADALHDGAAHLLVHQHGVDDAPAVLHRPVLEQPDEAGVRVHLDVADLHPVGEDEGVVALRVVARHHQLGREVLRQRVAAEVGDAAQFGQVQQRLAAVAVDDRAAVDAQALALALQDGFGRGQDVLAQHAAGLQHGLAADARAAAGPGAAAVGRGVGVAGDHAHAGQVHAHRVGGDLAEDALGPLALLADAAHHRQRPAGLQAQRGAVLAGDARPADAVEGGAGVGQLDQRGHADAAVHARLAQRGLLGAQRVVVHQAPGLAQAGLVRQHLELDARGAGGRVGVVRDHVGFAQRDRVDAQPRGHAVHQRLGHGAGDGVAHAPVLAGGRLVLEHHLQRSAVVPVLVGPAREVDDLVALDAAGAREHAEGADAGEVVDLEGQDLAGLGGRDAALDAVLAGVDVGDEALQPVGHELHRPLEHHAQRDGREVVGVGVHLDAEAAAHVAAQHAHLLLLQAELPAIQVLHHVRRLERVVHGQLAVRQRACGVPVGDLAARLQRDAGVAAEDVGLLEDRVGPGEGFVDAAGVQLALEAQVVAQLGVDQRRGRVQRGLGVEHGGQVFPLHLQQRQRVLGAGAGFGHHRHHRLALPGGAVHRHRVLRRALDAGQVRQRGHPGLAQLGDLGAHHHGDHAGQRLRRGAVDARDAHVRHRAAPEHHVRQAGQLDVVDVLAAALRQPAHALAGQRHADVALVFGDRGQLGAQVAVQRDFGGVVHALTCSSAKRPACCWASTAHTASTMAW